MRDLLGTVVAALVIYAPVIFLAYRVDAILREVRELREAVKLAKLEAKS